jgi:hypothetical protein
VPHTVECPRCRTRLAVPDAAIGKHAVCAKCGDRFTILKLHIREDEEASAEGPPEQDSPTETDLPPIAAANELIEAPASGEHQLPSPEKRECPFCNRLIATTAERCLFCHQLVSEENQRYVAAARQLLPSGAAYGNATTCYLCGNAIVKDEPRFRREVNTGRSAGTWVSRRSYGVGARQYFSVKTLCADCARQVDSRGCAKAAAILILGPTAATVAWWLA